MTGADPIAHGTGEFDGTATAAIYVRVSTKEQAERDECELRDGERVDLAAFERLVVISREGSFS